MPTFKEITGLSLEEYVLISLPKQVHIDDRRRAHAVEVAIRRYTQLVVDGLPIGYTFDGENIAENPNDPRPIGYPSKDGMIDLAEIIDKLNFRVVLDTYRKNPHL